MIANFAITFSPKDKGIIETRDYKSTPIARGLPAIPPVFLAEHLIFLTLTPRDWLTIAHIVGVTSRIVTIVRSDFTMLTAPRANILKPHHSTATIACHFLVPFFLCHDHTLCIVKSKRKKSVEKKDFYGTRFALPILQMIWHEIC
jgi:hypothetical protein